MGSIYNGDKKNKTTKKYRTDRCREIITSYAVRARFTDTDVDELRSLLGVQFQSAERRTNQTYPSDPANLWVLYDADCWESLSWRKCISPKTDIQTRYSAMRFSIADDIHELRGTLGAECETCGSLENLQVDHKNPTFKQIADEFIASNGMFEIINNHDGAGWVFCNKDSEAGWIAFHASRATYQMLCGSCNASKGAK